MKKYCIVITDSQRPTLQIVQVIRVRTETEAAKYLAGQRQLFTDLGLVTKGTGYKFEVWFDVLNTCTTYELKPYHE